MHQDLTARLVSLGFSEYEAKAYIALLRENPVTGYQLSKLSGVPRSMIYEVLDKLIARGAAMVLPSGDSVRYAPVPAPRFLDQLHREHEELVTSLKDDLAALASAPDLEYVWNIEGQRNIMARAIEMLHRTRVRAYMALLPVTFEALQPALAGAIQRGVRVVVYTPTPLDLPGGRVVITPMPLEALSQTGRLGLTLAVDGKEVLIAEWLSESEARGTWTSSPLLVFVTEHHLRTDLYLPQVLALLGDRALEVIQEEDRDLFAHALESHIED